MTIKKEISLTNFEAWSGGKDRFNVFTDEQLEELEKRLEELDTEGEGYDETKLNDLFWFSEDYLAQLIGFDDFEQLEKHNNGYDEEEDEEEEIEEYEADEPLEYVPDYNEQGQINNGFNMNLID